MKHTILLLAALLICGAQAADPAPVPQAQAAPAPAAPPLTAPASVIPKLRVVGDAPPAPAPVKKAHKRRCKYGAERVGGKLKCRHAAPAPP